MEISEEEDSLGRRKLDVQFVRTEDTECAGTYVYEVHVEGIGIGSLYEEYLWNFFSEAEEGATMIWCDYGKTLEELDVQTVRENEEEATVFIEGCTVGTLCRRYTWRFQPTERFRRAYRRYISTLWFLSDSGWENPDDALDVFQKALTEPLNKVYDARTGTQRIRCLLRFILKQKKTT